MPTRVVGTCCCGLPPFGCYGHIWVRIDTTWGLDGSSNIVTGFTLTYMGVVPPRWHKTFNGVEQSRWTPNSPMFDSQRTSFCGISLGTLNGGEYEDQLDPDNWAALITDLSSAPISFDATNSPVGAGNETYDSKMRFLTWTSDWSLPFAYDGVDYVATFSQGGHSDDRRTGEGKFYELSETEFQSPLPPGDHRTSLSWYACYELGDPTITRDLSANEGNSE